MTHTIGQRLKIEREEKRLTLEKVFEATRIRIQYLQALEADDLSVMPSPVQARGYLRNYAEYLGLDVEQLLDEMQVMNAQYTSGEIIGPADETSLTSYQNNTLLNILSATPMLEPKLDDKLADSEEPALPIKPKPAHRKKMDNDVSPFKPASVESTTKRRGGKKVKAETTSVKTQSETVQETAIPAESSSQFESVVKPITPIESVSQPSPTPGVSVDQPQSEPVANEGVNISQEPPEQADVSDTLWQTWLNRLGSVLSARTRRRTLIPKESPVLENEKIVASVESEITLEAEAHNYSLENSDEIFKEVGKELRTRRELLSLHFDEVERNTHVKAHYLDALERGALDELPSTVQTRGMLSNYATFLDLDVDALLLRFADALQARHRERNPQKPARKPGQPINANIPPVRNFIAGDMVFGVSMAILLVGFAIWGVSRVMAIQGQREIKPTAPSISDVLLASPNPASVVVTPTFILVEAFPGEATVTAEIPTQNLNAQVQLNLVAVERTYMRVVVDGEVAFEGRTVPGNAYPFEAENQVEVLVGSGAAIRVVYNGRDLGLMGSFGQVVNNIYLGTEIITPTALPTTTATITLTPTQTVAPTSTLRPTRTLVPSTTPVP